MMPRVSKCAEIGGYARSVSLCLWFTGRECVTWLRDTCRVEPRNGGRDGLSMMVTRF